MPLASLPIDEALPEIVAAVREKGVAVVQAPPGAGKTTRVPPALATVVEGRVIVVEPRRVAARAAARRIAEEQGWALGREVGYQVRFERLASAATRLLVVTEGVALNLLHADPFLTGVGALVFDEFHERNLASDLALALARKVRQEVRPDLALVVMSATLEAAPVAAFLGGAPVVASAGRQWPVEIELLARRDERPLPAQVASSVRRLLAETSGDLLVFLPGVREIERSSEALAELAREHGLRVLPLYGDLTPEQQDEALRPGASEGRRRVVLATNVAETSVTLEGVSAVVDSGLARILEHDPGCGLDRLVVARISQASAEQRAGRAGRQGPGRCLRLWTAAEQASLSRRSTPEILRVDLAGAVLQLLAWGETDVFTFGWFEAPERGRLEQALELLARLGANGPRGLTALGRRMASLPLHPRLARLLLAGEEHGCLRQAALAAALLSERSPFERRAGVGPAATTRSDLEDRVLALDRFARTGRAGEGLRAGGARRVLQVADQLAGWLGQRPSPQPSPRSRGARGPEEERSARERSQPRGSEEGRLGSSASSGALARSLLAAFPDRLARRREPGSRRGLMVGGRGVRLAPESGVSSVELFLCLEIDAGARGERAEAWVRMASEVEREWLVDLGPEVVTRTVETSFDAARERVAACERLRAWDLVLEEKEVPAQAEEAAEALARAAEQALDRIAVWAEGELASFLVRLRCLRVWMPELGLPAFTPEELRPLLPGLTVGRRSFDELRRLPWPEVLKGLLTPAQLAALEREAPERLPVPSGSNIRLQYEEGRPPVLPARIQELFGLAETPRIAAGRVPVLLHLLAPSGRPQQVTQDLASFWAQVYPQVRKELAGRYPRHAWPTDPWTAQPERRPGRRAS